MTKFLCAHSCLKNTTKASIVAVLALTITACGGGGDGSGSGSGSGIGEGNYVSGVFYSNSGLDSLPLDTVNCQGMDESRYFKSDNGTVIVGASGFPENDYRHAATLVELNLDSVLNEFGLSESEFVDLKASHSVDPRDISYAVESIIAEANKKGEDWQVVIPSVATLFANYYANNPSEGNYDPENPITSIVTDGEYFFDVFSNIWRDSSRADRINVVDEMASGNYADYGVAEVFNNNEPPLEMPKGTIVCLQDDNGKGMYGWGAGTDYGFKVTAKSQFSRSDDVIIAKHELVHFVQEVIVSSAGLDSLERWMAEGQAQYIAGMSVTTDKYHGRNPLLIATTWDEDHSIYGGGANNAYPDYAQAYEYIEATYGRNSVLDMMYGIRHSDEYQGIGSVSSPNSELEVNAFKVEFSKYFTDINDFRLNYTNILESSTF